MKKNKRIGIKIALLIGLVEIAAMVILFIVMNQSLTRILEDKAIDDMNVIARDRASIVEVYIDDCVDFLNGYAKATENREVLLHPEDQEKIQASRDYTKLYAEGYTDIEGLYVAQWDTYVLAHTNPDSVDQTFRDAESAKTLEDMIKAEGRPFCTGIVQAPVTKEMVIPVYAPIYDGKGEAIGFAGAAFLSNDLDNLLHSLSDGDKSGVGYSLLNAANGVYIFDYDKSVVGAECTDPGILDTIKRFKNGEGTDNCISYADGDRIVCCYYMEGRDWVFVESDTKSDIFAVIPVVRTILIAICLAITIAMVLICVTGVDRQMKPIKDINQAIERLKAGNYSMDPKVRAYREREDEFGTIATAVVELHSVLQSQNELFFEMLESQSNGILVLTAEEEDIVLINRTAMEFFGLSESDRSWLNIAMIRSKFEEEDNEFIKEKLDEVRNSNNEITFEETVRKSSDESINLLARAKGVVLSNKNRVIIISLTDITEQKRLEESLLILSETDFLTSICNRRSGEYRIEESMKNEKFGMFCLFDVDKFKFVNDNFGHAAGDAVLVALARTMQKTFRTSDILIRLGGDEFVVFALGIQDVDLGKRVLDRFFGNIESMDIPEIGEHSISVSLGAVIITETEDFSSMYEKADSLMYECKKHSGNTYVFYGESAGQPEELSGTTGDLMV